MFALIDNYTEEVLASSENRTELETQLHELQDETGLFIYSIVEEPEQGESIPETFYKADRERAHVGLSPVQLAYVEKLEAVLRAADAFWMSMQCCAMSPTQYRLSEALLEASALVNFCAEDDSVKLADCHSEEAELPRDVIFS